MYVLNDFVLNDARHEAVLAQTSILPPLGSGSRLYAYLCIPVAVMKDCGLLFNVQFFFFDKYLSKLYNVKYRKKVIGDLSSSPHLTTTVMDYRLKRLKLQILYIILCRI